MTFSAQQDQRIQLKLFTKQATRKVVINYLNTSQKLNLIGCVLLDKN